MTDTTHEAPDDLVKRLKIMARDIEMWEKLAWGSDSALMREAANRIEELEAKLAKAVEAMQFWSEAVEPDVDKAITLMASTLAELKRTGR
jgi:hypothetical protein